MLPRVFVTGATGYVGGNTTGVLMAAHPEYEVVALVRSEEQGSKLKSHWPSIITVVGTLDDDKVLKEESAKANVVLQLASSDHIPVINKLSLTICFIFNRTSQGRLNIFLAGHSIMTPRVLPVTNYVNPYLQAWLPMSMSDCALFPALLSSSLSHQRINDLLAGGAFLPHNRDIEPILQACYKETISAINASLRDPVRATTDATILAVLMPVGNPAFDREREWSQESPFHGLQWLSVHGAREPDIAHQDGLCKIINLRGGLASIETPGVAAAAFYRVLVNSTLSLSPPSLPFFPLSGKDTQVLKGITTNGPMSAAPRIDFFHEAGLIPVIASGLQGLADYISSIESYIEEMR